MIKTHSFLRYDQCDQIWRFLSGHTGYDQLSSQKRLYFVQGDLSIYNDDVVLQQLGRQNIESGYTYLMLGVGM